MPRVKSTGRKLAQMKKDRRELAKERREERHESHLKAKRALNRLRSRN